MTPPSNRPCLNCGRPFSDHHDLADMNACSVAWLADPDRTPHELIRYHQGSLTGVLEGFRAAMEHPELIQVFPLTLADQIEVLHEAATRLETIATATT